MRHRLRAGLRLSTLPAARRRLRWGIPLVNAVTHIGAAIVHGAYNPGLLSSLVLFVPLVAWMLHVVRGAGLVEGRQVVRVIGTGVAVHAVLMASLLGREHGMPYAVLLAVNVLNGLWPLAFGLLGRDRAPAGAQARLGM